MFVDKRGKRKGGSLIERSTVRAY